MPTYLHIDIETFSSVSLKTGGVYKYVEADDFEILLFAYSIDAGPVKVLDFAGKNASFELMYFRSKIVAMLLDPEVIKLAHNATFERVCIGKSINRRLDASQWRCTMVGAAMLGLPFALEQVGRVLHLTEQKDATGKALIRFFTMPCKPTKANGNRTRNLPEHAPEKWQNFIEYCRQDVKAEKDIYKRIEAFYVTDKERYVYALDQLINDRGAKLDRELIEGALIIADEHTEQLTGEAKALTGLANPNSLQQLKKWIAQKTGWTIAGLTKDDTTALLNRPNLKFEVKRVLNIRQELSKTSNKKYSTMRDCINADDRARGLLQYYGANRTGRWGGRKIQPQNLTRNYMKRLDIARKVVKTTNYNLAAMLYDNIPDMLSQLIRTSFIASPGCRFIISDFSAIEARVIAWLAGERWRIDVFNSHGKIYEASAAQMFKVDIKEIDKGSPLRQKGKIAELALGYQGGVSALTAMGAIKMGLVEDELQEIVNRWRAANQKIVSFWSSVEDSAYAAVDLPGSQVYNAHARCKFEVRKGILFIKLPSGRSLCYWHPRLGKNRFGNSCILYDGLNQTSKKWETQETYGGKLVENIVQAVARDLLAEKMILLDEAHYNIVLHVHDEIISDMRYGCGSVDEVNKIMALPVAWAPGLPLKAESFETEFYMKD